MSARQDSQHQRDGGGPHSLELKLQDICSCLQVDYDGARYALAQGLLPSGVEPDPGRGRHRVFSQEQAFYLAVALKLKEAGLSLPRIREIVPWTRKIQEWSVNLNFDPLFAPFTGGLIAEHKWFLDIGDAKFVRLRTTAVPSRPEEEATPWVNMKTRRESRDARPAVLIAINIGEVARLLAAAPAR